MIFGNLFRWLGGIYTRMTDTWRIRREDESPAIVEPIVRTPGACDVTFVTYAELPQGDPDDLLALKLLRERGYKAQAAVWNDPAVNWGKAGLCVIRSTWDYHLQQPTFMAWAEQLAATTRLVNPIELIRWNIDKKVYMRDLAHKGAPVIETIWAYKGEKFDLKKLMEMKGWSRAVIKPCVGCGTYKIMRVTSDAEGLIKSQAHLDELLVTGDAMIQPYVDAVETYGERALTFINGKFSHATLKTAFQKLLPTGQAGEQPVKASAKEITAATKILALVKPRPLYARVDLIPDNHGRICLLELELVEPSLFLSMDNAAPRRFADAIANLLGKPGSAK